MGRNANDRLKQKARLRLVPITQTPKPDLKSVSRSLSGAVSMG
jgi:hypothetical protein